ncbi:hypothetical protein NQ317_015284 [Molorchus minor]|uniref:Uncharacterized protein n=1 Tax=Molorchus minor TaxID=1323400 RepID=A0ABQ9IYV6_9CUCU|nr:hypothetical protein NQ317_015284 [Molorchus minor]
MSQEGSINDSSNFHSESSGSSPCQTPFFQEHFIKDSNTDITDLTLFGTAAPTLMRTSTVRRANTTPVKKEKESLNIINGNEDMQDTVSNKIPEQSISHRYRKSLDSTFRYVENNTYIFRNSLDSISEHKIRSFSPSFYTNSTSRDCSSLDSSSSELVDNAVRSSSGYGDENNKTLQSPSSSYLTWIESVNTEYFGTESAVPSSDRVEGDNKVGEWNNFWLNYNNARGEYLSNSHLNAEDKMADDISEVKSSCSTHRELTEKTSGEYITFTLEEIQEAMKCTQRITEILQNALRRNDQDAENLNVENSYYSESISCHNSSIKEESRELTKEDLRKYTRDRSMSYAVTSAELLKQKEMLKPSSAQSSSTSCINALLNTGVADILKRVISRRRDVISPDGRSTLTRSSFSEWSGK